MKVKIKWIIFDFDEVISKSFYWYNMLFDEIDKKIKVDKEKGVRFLIKNSKYWFCHRWNEKQLLKKLNKYLRSSIPFSVFNKAIYKTILPNNDTIKIIKILKKRKYKIGLLTDNPKIRTEKIVTNTKLKGLFNYTAGSSQIGKLKKDKSTFTYIIKALKTKPEEILFIDDNKDNCNCASIVGIKTLQFKLNKNNYRRLKKELTKLNVL